MTVEKPGKHYLAAAAAKSLQSCLTLCEPTRLPHPWDSPGKNTGVGCHFFLQCMKVKRESEVAQLYLTLSDPVDRSLPALHPWDFPGKSAGVGCHCLPCQYLLGTSRSKVVNGSLASHRGLSCSQDGYPYLEIPLTESI